MSQSQLEAYARQRKFRPKMENVQICEQCDHLIRDRYCSKFGKCPDAQKDFFKALERSKCPLEKFPSQLSE